MAVGAHSRGELDEGRWGWRHGRSPGRHRRRRHLRLGRAFRLFGTGVGAIGLAVALLGQSGIVDAPSAQLAAQSTSTAPLLVVANRVSASSVNNGDGDLVTYPTTATTPTGTFDGIDAPDDAAIDPVTGDVWVSNANNNTLEVLTPSALRSLGSSTTPLAKYTYSTGGYPEALTFDPSGDLFIGNSTGSVDEFTAGEISGATNGGTLTTSFQLVAGSSSTAPVTGIAANGTDVWIVTQGGTSNAALAEYQYQSGTQVWSTVLEGHGGISVYPWGLALDSSGDLWVSTVSSTTGNGGIEEYSSSQLASASSGTPLKAHVTIYGANTELSSPRGLTFDSSGNLWVANYGGSDLLEFSESQLYSLLSSSTVPGPKTTIGEPSGDQPSGLVVLPAVTQTPSSTVHLTPSSYDFGTIPSGQTATETFQVTSDATTSVSFGAIALGGSDPDAFSLSNTCPGTLAAGASCDIQVAVSTGDQPTNGQVSAVLQVPITNGPMLESTVSVTIGAADQPIAQVSPSTLHFGDVTYGNAKVRTVTLENLGAAALSFHGATINDWRPLQSQGEFSVQADACSGATLDQGSSCSLSVEFAPSAKATGLQSATLVLDDSAGSQLVVLQGTAVTSLADQGLQASPSSLDFGSVNAGLGGLSLQLILDNYKTVTIQNTGPDPVIMGNGADTVTPPTGQAPAFYSLGNLSLLGLDHHLYHEVASLLDTCQGKTLAVGQSCSAGVIFFPPHAGAYSATLSLPTSEGTFSVPLAGMGVRFGLVSSPSSVHFGDVPLGAASAPHNLTLSLQSAELADLGIVNAEFTGPNPGAFHYASLSGCQTLTLVSGEASCTLPVVFRPTQGGPESTDLQLYWEGSTLAGESVAGVLDVPLYGTGVVGSGTVSVNPSTLLFGPVQVGDSSDLSVVLTNTSSNGAPVAVYGSEVLGTGTKDSFPAEFGVVTGPCEGVVLRSGSACVVSAEFSPVVGGDAKADLVIETSAGQETVALGGVGTTTPAPAAGLSPTSLSFTSSTPSVQDVTVTNIGQPGSELAISSVSVAGVNPAAFTVVPSTDTCASHYVEAGSNCSFQVQFTPHSTGPKNAEVLIGDNAPGSPQVVSLSGAGARVLASITPSPYDFGGVVVGTGSPVSETFQVTNEPSSTGDLSVAGATISTSSPNPKSFSVPGAEDACVDATLAPGTSCTVVVTFDPQVVGSLSATLDVEDSALNQPQQVSLSGIGVAPPSPVSGTGTSSSSVTTETEDGVTVSATGTGTFTLTWYGSTQPSSATTPSGFTSTGRFLDLYVTPGSDFSAITLEDCHLAGGNELWWFDAASGTWVETSGTYDATNGCWTLALSGTSSPTIGQLTGTVFDAGLAATTPPSGGGGGGGTTLTPTTITSPSTNPTSSVGTITASGVGTGTITLNSYGDVPPTPASALSDGVSYFTMELADSSVLSSLHLTVCQLTSADALWYWTGSGWAEVSPQSFDAAAGCLVSTLGSATSPTIPDLLSTTVIFGVSGPAPKVTTTPLSVTQPSQAAQGYWVFGADGGVFSFGGAQFYGSVPQVLGAKAETLAAPITGAAVPAGGGGYWMVGSDGGVFAFGDAPYLGSLPGQGIVPSAPIVSILSDPAGPGYWLIGADGGVFTFGDARFFGSLPSEGQTPAGPIVSAAVMPDGLGYWLVSADGQVYAFGAAGNFGSTVSLGLHLAAPIVSIVASPDGAGYWLVGADGGVFTFGDAGFFGSLPALGVHPANPVSAATMSASGGLYLTGGKLGGVFTLGSAPYLGSIPGLGLVPDKPIVAIEPSDGMG